MLLFGVIEFARVFQAWLSVQNGARFGVRYAVTGEYNPAYCGLADGALGLTAADAADGQIDCRVPPSYDKDHFEEMTDQLIDWARIPSIHDVARQGAVAIQKDTTAVVGQPRFFQVTVCSSRDANDDKDPDFVLSPPNQSTFTPAFCYPKTDPAHHQEDAGAPGDRVTVVIDFNHPLDLAVGFLALASGASHCNPGGSGRAFPHFAGDQPAAGHQPADLYAHDHADSDGVAHINAILDADSNTNPGLQSDLPR